MCYTADLNNLQLVLRDWRSISNIIKYYIILQYIYMCIYVYMYIYIYMCVCVSQYVTIELNHLNFNQLSEIGQSPSNSVSEDMHVCSLATLPPCSV